MQAVFLQNLGQLCRTRKWGRLRANELARSRPKSGNFGQRRPTHPDSAEVWRIWAKYGLNSPNLGSNSAPSTKHWRSFAQICGRTRPMCGKLHPVCGKLGPMMRGVTWRGRQSCGSGVALAGVRRLGAAWCGLRRARPVCEGQGVRRTRTLGGHAAVLPENFV